MSIFGVGAGALASGAASVASGVVAAALLVPTGTAIMSPSPQQPDTQLIQYGTTK